MVLNESLQNLVIDEADLVLSFGYEDDLRKILSYLPKIYQSFLMSATFTKVKVLLKCYKYLNADEQCYFTGN